MARLPVWSGLAWTLATFLLAAEAQAAIVTFDGLTGAERAPFPEPYVESDFRIMPITGRWFEAHGINTTGKPIPAIAGDTFTAALEVSRIDSGAFAFASVDITSSVDYLFEGFLAGAPVFASGGFTALAITPGGFVTIASPSSASIDLLRVSIVRDQTEGYGLDNVNVTGATVVPEPSSAVILGALLGLAALGSRPRRP